MTKSLNLVTLLLTTLLTLVLLEEGNGANIAVGQPCPNPAAAGDVCDPAGPLLCLDGKCSCNVTLGWNAAATPASCTHGTAVVGAECVADQSRTADKTCFNSPHMNCTGGKCACWDGKVVYEKDNRTCWSKFPNRQVGLAGGAGSFSAFCLWVMMGLSVILATASPVPA